MNIRIGGLDGRNFGRARTGLRFGLVAALAALGLSFAAPPDSPINDELVVNTTTALAQTAPAAARDADGDAVLVWQGAGATDSGDIFLQRYGSNGVAAGAETRVNTTTTDLQSNPVVAMDAAGNFVVAWESNLQDSAGTGIYAQRYNSAGARLGSEFKVNTTVASSQNAPSLSMDAAGNFVVAWESQDANGRGIYAQRYATDGSVQGGEFQVNTVVQASQKFPSVSMAAGGAFVIAWQSNNQDGDLNGIYAQRYSAAGATVGGETRLNQATAGEQTNPAVALRADGSFVAAWVGPDAAGTDTNIFIRRFDASSQALDVADVPANGVVAGIQAAPMLTVDAVGNFLVGWESNGQDGSGYGVYFRRYNQSGVAQGSSDQQANTTTAADQRAPALAVDADGDYLVVWQGAATGDAGNILLRRYVGPEAIDLEITQVDDQDPVAPSTTFPPSTVALTYTLTVTNNHATVSPTGIALIDQAIGAATTVKVEDTLPANTSFVSATGTNWTCANAGGVVTCNYTGSYKAQTTSTIAVRVNTPTTVSSGNQLSNVATLSAGQDDPVAANNTDTETTNFCGATDDVGSFSIVDASTTSESGAASLTVRRTPAAGRMLCGKATVRYASSDGTAKVNADYSSASGVLSFDDSNTSDQVQTQTISVPVLADELDENSETVNLTLSAASQGSISDAQGVLTIQDDDNAPVVSLSESASSVAEGAGTKLIDFSIDKLSGRDVVIPFSTSGTASKGGTTSDYTTTPTTQVTITAGSTTASLTLNIDDDSRDEVDETAIITIAAPTGTDPSYQKGATATDTVTITDNDGEPSVSFALATSSQAEGGTKQVVVSLSAASGQPITVNYGLSGTATSGADYTVAPSAQLSFAPGETSKNVAVTVKTDSLDESNETVVLTLNTPVNANLGTAAAHTLTIQDADSSPTVSFTQAAQTLAESGGNASITARLSAPSALEVTVPYSVSGTAAKGPAVDYDLSPDIGQLTIPAGMTDAVLTVQIHDDLLNEANETVVVTMGQPSNASPGATTTHSLTISNNDPVPEVNFDPGAQSVREDLASGQATALVKLSAVSGQAVSVPYTVSGTASNGSDYSLSPASPLVIPAGSSTGTLNFTLSNDASQEADETAVLTIGTPVNASKGANATHTLTLVDDDSVPQASFAVDQQTAAEGAGTVTAVVKLSRAADRDVTIRYSLAGSAVNGSDYSAAPTSPLVIAEGETSAPISITITDDPDIENTETVSLSLDSAVGATLLAPTQHLLTVTDNDVAGVTVSQSGASTNVTEGSSGDSYTLVLDARPTSDVVVDLSYGAQVLTSPATALTFTSANWNLPQTVTVAAVDDQVAESDHSASVSHSTSATDMNFQGLTVASVPVTITDNDVASVSITESDGATTVTEGGATDSYTMVLTSQPSADVTISLSPDAQLGTDRISLVFTSANWNLAQTVTVTAFNDQIAEGAHQGSILHGISSADPAFGSLSIRRIDAQIADDDSVGLVLSKSAVSVAEGGASDSYTVKLNSQPTGNVTVTIDAGAQLRAASGGTASQIITLSFTPNGGMPGGWDVAQTVTVTALDDASAEGSHSGMLVHSTASDDDDAYVISMAGNINAGITDNDNAGFTVAPTSVSVTEGGAGTDYTIMLTSQPTADVVLSLSTDNQQVLLSATELSFTLADWNQPQTVTVTAKDDAVAEGNHSSTVLHVAASDDASYSQRSVPNVNAAIADNDAPGVVIVETGGSTAATEAGAGDSYSVKLNSEPTADVTVTISQSPSGQFALAPATLTFTAANYASGQSVTVNSVDDSTVDGDINVTLSHAAASSDSRYQSLKSDLTAKALDNDAAVTLTPASKTVAESATAVSYNAHRVGASNQAASVAYATSDGSATAGQDYTVATGTVSFAAGETDKAVTVSLQPDTSDEADESFALTLSGPSANLVLGSPATATTTITDDDATPSLSIGNATVTEGNSGSATATFTVSLSAASGQTVTVSYATANGTATAGSDYTAKNGTLSFAPGTTSQTIAVVVSGDVVDEADETFSVALSGPTNASIGTGAGTGTITDDDATPSLSIGNATVTEGNSGSATATFTVSLSAASGQSVSVSYATADGTATAGSDYTARSGTLTFAPGTTTQTLAVTVTGDAIDELDEAFTLALSAPTNATVANGTGTGTITDDDGAPSLSISNATVTEGNSGAATARFTVTLSAASGQTVTVAYATANGSATAGSDYTAKNGTLTFAPGSTSQPITIAVTGDTVDEADETFTVALSAPSNATISTGTGVGTITDDDATPSLSIGNATVTEGNSGSATASFTVSLSAASGQTVTVSYATANGTATAGSDYTAKTGTLTFAPGATSQPVTIAVAGDVADEADETFTVTLSAPSNAGIGTGTGTGTIGDDDATPRLSIGNSTVTEGNSGSATASFTVSLSAASGQTVTVSYATANGTATAGADYTAKNGMLSFAPGVTNQSLAVSVNGDVVDEADESFTVALSGASNAAIGTGTGTGTITDDDGAGVALSQSGGTTGVSEGGADDAYGLVLTSQPTGNVSIAANGGTQLRVSPATVVFTPANWNQAQTVTVSAVDDTVSEGNHGGVLSHTASSADSKYNAVAIPVVQVSIADNDVSRVSTTDSSGKPLQAESSSGVLTVNSTATQPSSAPTNYQYRNGFFDIRVTGITPGSTVVVTLMPTSDLNPVAYVKCRPDGSGCVEYGNASIQGKVISITLTDGGVGDDDGIANGRIQDPGAPAYPKVDLGEGGGGSLPMSLLTLLLGAAIWRRRSVSRVS
ncbi:MAG: Calx-beta domain-containing protein [Stagnimonas sp.]|nr:Calx-beta domain-containing protein [Stagnimonas sp.]